MMLVRESMERKLRAAWRPAPTHQYIDIRCMRPQFFPHTSTFDASGHLMPRPLDLLQGTLDLLILKTLTWGPAHGYAIARWIEQLTGEVLRIGEGSLYPALHRLEERGWVAATWELSDAGRRMRVYRLTPKGRAQLKAESGTWKQFVTAVGKVLDASEQPL